MDVPRGSVDGDTQLDPDATDPGPPGDDPSPDMPFDEGTPPDAWNESIVLRSFVDPGGGGSGDPTIDRAAIVNYALQYVGPLNSDSHTGWNTDYASFPNDCQNFASQALFAGGWTIDGGQFSFSPRDADHWWYIHGTIAPTYSYSWSAVVYFQRYVQLHPERGTFVRYWSRLAPGDLIQVDWQGGAFDHDGANVSPTHTMVVTGLVHAADGSLKDILVTYHTTNRRNKSLVSLQRTFPHAVWWGIHLKPSFAG
jgi:hypothetical protein